MNTNIHKLEVTS